VEVKRLLHQRDEVWATVAVAGASVYPEEDAAALGRKGQQGGVDQERVSAANLSASEREPGDRENSSVDSVVVGNGTGGTVFGFRGCLPVVHEHGGAVTLLRDG